MTSAEIEPGVLRLSSACEWVPQLVKPEESEVAQMEVSELRIPGATCVAAIDEQPDKARSIRYAGALRYLLLSLALSWRIFISSYSQFS